MNKIFLPVIALLFHLSASGQQLQHQDGLYYEVPDSSNLGNPDFFNQDNQIYKPGREFIYAYYLLKKADSFYVRVNQINDTKTQNWTLISPAQIDSLTIGFMGFEVQRGYGGMDHLFPDYSQTIIAQKYYSVHKQLLFDGSTGLIENKNNIWLHPFRGKYFSVLEFSPFPYVQLPLVKGNRWTWLLTDISERWSDNRIITYQGKQQATYQYKITGKKNIQTTFGPKICYVTEAEANTTLGLTRLTSYFHPEMGFMRLDYTNIDGSVIRLVLVEVRS
ncbi:MAG: hypothetical protein ACXWV0_06915 [Flavisolibacter sp.]